MKKIRPLLFLILALLAGWGIGSYTSDHFYNQWIQRYLARNALDGVGDRFATLNALRAGDTNQVVELLESQLDGQIMALGAAMRESPAAQRPAAEVKLLARLQDYRAVHPRTTSRPEIDQKVAAILTATNPPNHQ